MSDWSDKASTVNAKWLRKMPARWLRVILHSGAMQTDAVAERGKQSGKRAVEVEAIPASTTANDSLGRLERIEGGRPLELGVNHL